MPVTRRELLGAGLAGLGSTALGQTNSPAATQPGGALPLHQQRSGEPYRLLGRRIVFTSWYHVRTGSFVWRDEAGKSVGVAGSSGPFEAKLESYDRPSGIRLRVQPAERIGRVIEPEKPWEQLGVSLNTLLYDGGRYRAWGSCAGKAGENFLVYYESENGLDWKRPRAKSIEYNGSTDNNLLAHEGMNGGFFIDPHAPATERYKWVSEGTISQAQYDAYRRRWPEAWEARVERSDAGLILAVRGGVSPDGLHWTALEEPLVVEHSDTHVLAYYDTVVRKYVVYTRNWWVGPRVAAEPDAGPWAWIGVGRRSIGRTESDDFRHFPLSQMVLVPSPEFMPSDVLYTNGRTCIPGAPDHHLMFPTVWHMHSDNTSTILASSSDGKVWNYVPGPPVFKTPSFGAWDGGCTFARPNLTELPDGRWVLPYTGYNFPHKYPRGQWRYGSGYMAWPHGRLAALEAPELGEFATVAVIAPGRQLRVNARSERAGYVKVEAAGLNGAPVPGRGFSEAVPIIGDHPRTIVTWKQHDNLGVEPGAPIMLRFKLSMAKIFGLEFV